MKLEKGLNNNSSFILRGKYRMRKNNAQMILLAAIIISVTLLIMSTVASSLSKVGTATFRREKLSLYREYRAVRTIFRMRLYYSLLDIKEPSYKELAGIVHNISQKLSMIEERYGYEFNAELIDAEALSPRYVYITVKMSLQSGSESVNEEWARGFIVNREV